ncbi:Ig-like domain-containing protein [Blautia massiliensis (ex Durand et al. 2017)]|uniref:Ig-like domain-containing protein n=1 Tax=Blautia massiliensis (ex Durand et al. 2017) TaxID=1737424 RepID=UPI00241DDF98|nr:Ig-like domain-containing protein [Blautia massiliensis (ex Durand et al. 2017)]MBN2958000.1 Ig-like domain-containing protein [Blautia massiliensis (ex Durand et al. 2017)]
MKKKRIAMLLAATLTFSQSMGAAIPVAAEELTADTGQETAETEESVQENDDSETTGEAASVPDLEDDEELSIQDDAENAEEEIAEEENTSEITELFGDNTENQEVFNDGSEGGESAEANEQYQLNLIFEGASGGQDLLPNSHVRIKSRLVDTIGCSDVSAYELKVAPVTGGNGVKMADVSLDGQDIVLDVYNKTGDARISATAFINGTEVAKREFGVNISEYVILPEKITDTSGNEINLEVGQQLDIAKDMKPQLVRYKDGKGDPIPVTGDNYKIVMSQTGPGGEELRDYDADGLKWIEVPGQDLPILERTTENSTWFALLAMERSENGDWHYITRHHYELNPLNNSDYDNGHNDDSEEKSSYRLIYDYQDTTGNEAMLPNSQMTATTYLEDKTKDYQRVDDYKLEILEQSKLADISVSADGKKLVIKSGNKTGQGCCYISVQIPDGKGGYREAFRKDMWFSVSEYVILPEKITDTSGNEINLEVGQQLDIAKDMKPQLVRYKDGKGDPIPVTGDNYKIVISSWTDESTGTVYHDYDTDGWKWIDVPGQELPILERTSGYGTYFGLTAMEKSADGNWHQIARRMYEVDTLPGYNGDDSGNFGDSGHDSDDSEEKSFYNLTYDLEGTAGNEAMLPNNETTIVTDILDKTSGQHPVKDYKLEIIEQSKLAEATVSPDGKKLIIKSNDKTGVGCCYVAVKLLDKTGEYKEAFRKDIWFEVSEFMLIPDNLTDKNGKLLNPAVGESINLANLKVKLVQYINGKGDPVEITGNDIKIVVMSWKDTESGKLQYDYDDEAWNMQKVSGQELPIMTRKSDDNTRLALSAMRKNKNGEWERLVRKHFEIGENSSKHSHSWKAVKTVQATCTSKGSRTDKCTSCDGIRTVTLPAKHTAVKDAAIAATVFKAGKKEGSHCKVCGKVLRKQITVAKLKPTISLTASSLKMKAGQSTTAFKAAGLAKGDYVTKVTSGNTGIVKVSSVTKKGTFKLTAGKKAGSTTVKVILASKKSASFKVTVQRGAVKTSKITVSTKSVTLKKGTTYRKLASSVKVTPVTSQEKVTYTSSNKKIATVTSGGVIKGLKKGTATITIRSGSKRTTCKVTVK